MPPHSPFLTEKPPAVRSSSPQPMFSPKLISTEQGHTQGILEYFKLPTTLTINLLYNRLPSKSTRSTAFEVSTRLLLPQQPCSPHLTRGGGTYKSLIGNDMKGLFYGTIEESHLIVAPRIAFSSESVPRKIIFRWRKIGLIQALLVLTTHRNCLYSSILEVVK
jgi:hypothetical protein